MLTADGVTSTLGYDADGRRVSSRTGNGAAVGSAYDTTGDYPVLLTRGGTAFLRDPDGQLLGETVGGVTSTPMVDALGTVRGLTSATGEAVGTTSYDAYGAVRSSNGRQSMLGYTGAPTDPGGLIDLNARQYAPGLGQFLQRDTIRPAGPGTGTTINFSNVAWNDARIGVTVEQDLGALYLTWSQVSPAAYRKDVYRPVMEAAQWIVERPAQGGVTGGGNVARHDIGGKNGWRVDVENL